MTGSLVRKSLLSCLLTFGLAGLSTAQPPTGAGPTALRAKEILGAKISIQGGTAVGTVEDIVFTDAGDVEYLIVTTSDNKLVTVPWAAAAFNVQQKTAVVQITQDQFRAIPTYTVQTYPQFFTPTYRTEVYKYYGLTPGQLRRIERKVIPGKP